MFQSTLERISDTIGALRDPVPEERDDLNSPSSGYQNFEEFDLDSVSGTCHNDNKTEEGENKIESTQPYVISRVKTFGSNVLTNLTEVVTNTTSSSRRQQISNFAGCVTHSACDKLQVLSHFTNNVTSSVTSRIRQGKPRSDPLIDPETFKGPRTD
jgi:hypothetical protein